MNGVKGQTLLLNLLRMQACLTYTRLDCLKNIRINSRFKHSIHFQKNFTKIEDFHFLYNFFLNDIDLYIDIPIYI